MLSKFTIGRKLILKSSPVCTRCNFCMINTKSLEFLKTSPPFQSNIAFVKTKQTKNYIFKSRNNILSSFFNLGDNVKDGYFSFIQRHSPEAYVARSPPSIKPVLQLIRADKPAGSLLLYFPCVFSICLATPFGELPSIYYLGLFGVGSFLMRSAGCIINDLWDKDFDKKVDRTKNRPLASGTVSVKNAIKVLAGSLTLSLGVLLSLNVTCIQIGFLSMIPVVLYPLAKRFTYFPQFVLGLTFNIGAIMGYTAVTGDLNWGVVGPLYGSCLMWTMYYDTIYAFQDVEDDKLIGVKSTARLFDRKSESELMELNLHDRMKEGSFRKTKIALFLWSLAASHLCLFTLTGLSIDLNGPFYLAMAVAAIRTVDEVINLDTSSRDSCWKAFCNTKLHAIILTLGIVTTIYIRSTTKEPEKFIETKKQE